MFDDRSGAMVGVDFDEEMQAELQKPFKDRLVDVQRRGFQKAGKGAGVPIKAQGPVFTIGEKVEVKGRPFEVRGFDGGLLHLQGVPVL